MNREENPVGDWTLTIYDVDNPKSTGHLLNWTLTLYGEQDPEFVGTPIHTTIGFHEDKEHEVTITTTTAASTPTDVDNTPSRPTRIKPESKPSEVASITPTPTEASSSSFEDNAQKGADDYLTVVYVIFGSLAVFGVATGLYFYKRNSWHPLDKIDRQQPRPGGYEFDVLQPLTEHDEEDEEEEERLGNH